LKVQQGYRAGIYCRLSVDDGTTGESMSIGNQRAMLVEYVQKQGWSIEDVYVDDGWSGTSFDRPDFQRMISDIEAGRINCVVVKDLSRLGRNYILCGQYTEIYFPQKNVRFVALNDGIDSLHSNNDIAPFKNILNDMYAKDISVKSRSALQAKARRGEYLGSCDPYGYLRDPKDKHHLVINPEVASNVKRMFEMAAVGNTGYRIAKTLQEEGILTPGDYLRWCAHDPADGPFVPKYKWDQAVVRQMLVNAMFAGHMVQCRKRSESYRTHKVVWNPKEDWVIVNNTHEPIVPQALFDRVQKLIESKTPAIKKRGEPHIFSGMFVCKACGRKMAHHARSNSYGDYYSCGNYRANGSGACTSHYITVQHLEDIVLADVQKYAHLLESDEASAIQKILSIKFAEEGKRLSKSKRELARQQKRQAELDSHIKRVYEDNITGRIPNELFNTFLADYETERTALKESIRALDIEVRAMESAQTDVSQFVALLREYTGITALNRQMVVKLIDRIVIDEAPEKIGRRRKQTVEIHYKFAGHVF